MKIIKHGLLPEERVYRVTCIACKCVFDAEQSEGVYVSDQRDGDFVRFKCPTCNRDVYGYPGQYRRSE